MQDPIPPSLLHRAGRETIAYRALEGAGPGVMFLGGFMSDMTGTKASALDAHCRSTGRAFVRFDYSGHGESGGAFRDGTIGAWRDDALAVLDQVAAGPQILVGSSMGGLDHAAGGAGAARARRRPRRHRRGAGLHRGPHLGPRSTMRRGGPSPRPAKS